MTYSYWEYGKRHPVLYLKDSQEQIILYINYTCEAVYNTTLSARHRAVLKELFMTIIKLDYILVQKEEINLTD